MNFRHLLALLAITLGVFSSCGDDTSVPSDTPDKPGTSDVTTIQLQLSAEVSLPDVILPNGTRSMDFDVSQAIPKVLESSTWDTHMFLRKKGDDSFVGYAYVQWNVLGRGDDGRLRLKSNGTTISVQNANGKVPLNGEDWYIAGVAGGGQISADRTTVSFSYDEALDGNLPFNRVRVPFSFAWTKLDIDAANLSTATVTMKPQGSLINLIATNSSGKALDEALGAGFELQTTNLDREGYFDYSINNNAISTVEANAMPSWKFTNTTPVLNKHRVKFSGENGTQSNWLVWGMPRTDASPNTTMKGYRNVYIKGTNTLMTSNRQFTAGLAYYAYVDIKEYGSTFTNNKMPFDLIRGFVGTDGTSIVPLDDNIQNFDSRIGYHTPDVALSKPNLPSYFELAVLFPMDSVTGGVNHHYTPAAYYADGKREDYVSPEIGWMQRYPDQAVIGGQDLFGYYRQQYYIGQSIVMLRFIGSNGDNSKRMAYRYYEDENDRTVIQMKFVGDAPNVTIFTISELSFWKTYDKKIVMPNALNDYLASGYDSKIVYGMPYRPEVDGTHLIPSGFGQALLDPPYSHHTRMYFKESYKGTDYAHSILVGGYSQSSYTLIKSLAFMRYYFGRIPYHPELLTATYPILLIDKQ